MHILAQQGKVEKKKIKFDDVTSAQIKLIPGEYILDKDQINLFGYKA